MPRRLTITLAFLLTGLFIAGLPRSGVAAPASVATSSALRSTTINSDDATPIARDACSLSGLVPAHGSNCPDTSRLRRQAWGIPFIPDPVPVVKKVVGGGVASAIKSVALASILGWVASGAEAALKETAKVIDDTTSPQLTSSWFSASYWRVAGIAALLTLPFLCAAAIHALVRSDLGLLTRAAFGYLPLSLLAVAIASQLTMLLLAGTDEMSAIVASASLHADGVFLSTTSVRAVAESAATGDPFVTFLAAIITVAATLTLWLELLVRDAAVYVIVLMLPLFFAAMVWPARRTLAVRAIETLIALILSKFAIVAVLSLGGAVLGHSATPGAASVLTGGTLVLLAAFTPWALLRILPLHEVASAAAGGLSHAPRQTLSSSAGRALNFADGSSALGAAWLGRGAHADGQRSILGGVSGPEPRAAADAGPELGADHVSNEPVDADAAEPVTSAMSASAGTGDGAAPGSPSGSGSGSVSEPGSRPGSLSGSGSPSEPGSGSGSGSGSAAVAGSVSDGTPGSQPADGRAGDVPGPARDQPAAETDSVPRWPPVLPFLGASGDGDPRLPLGPELLELADERRLPPAGAETTEEDPASTSAAGPPAPLEFDPIDGRDA